MVAGIEVFRSYFEGHEKEYAIIGGAACQLIFNQVGLPFRATKDVDLVLCVEVVDAAFGTRFREFLDAGGYRARERSDRREFYRFHQPNTEGFPSMLEIFARDPAKLDFSDAGAITRIPVEEDVVSLSAILLEEAYFDALQSNRRVIDGVSVLDERLLIPFKAHAFVDLTRRRAEGELAKGDDIRKHRNDVFRLLQLLPTDAVVDVDERIREDLRAYIKIISDDGDFDPSAFDVGIPRAEGIALLRSAYVLEDAV